MAAGRPVVASPVGANRQVVRHGINGFLADSTEEWITALKSCAADTELRRRLGAAARRTVEETYSLDRVIARVAAVLSEAAAKPSVT
jgi:glycosyltransferase involved in cell wall biosynthesis